MTPVAPVPGDAGLRAPPLSRRLACFVYEGVLLFGVVMLAGYLYGSLTQQRHALHGQWGLRFFLFLVLGVYFVWFWCHGGQTVAMKTWHIRLVDAAGLPVTQWRALARYLLCWIWFLPALATVWLSGLQGGLSFTAALLAGVLGYAALSRLHGQRQYWHDVVCGTRLVDTRPS
jgi:uncharacterized RDD family membrane protein YckC